MNTPLWSVTFYTTFIEWHITIVFTPFFQKLIAWFLQKFKVSILPIIFVAWWCSLLIPRHAMKTCPSLHRMSFRNGGKIFTLNRNIIGSKLCLKTGHVDHTSSWQDISCSYSCSRFWGISNEKTCSKLFMDSNASTSIPIDRKIKCKPYWTGLNVLTDHKQVIATIGQHSCLQDIRTVFDASALRNIMQDNKYKD